MKKLLTIAFAMLLGATLSIAQAGTGSTSKPADTTTTAPPAKTKTKTGHTHKKGAKKGKKTSSDTTPASAPK